LIVFRQSYDSHVAKQQPATSTSTPQLRPAAVNRTLAPPHELQQQLSAPSARYVVCGNLPRALDFFLTRARPVLRPPVLSRRDIARDIRSTPEGRRDPSSLSPGFSAGRGSYRGTLPRLPAPRVLKCVGAARPRRRAFEPSADSCILRDTKLHPSKNDNHDTPWRLPRPHGVRRHRQFATRRRL
jgi:hypothetical protein